MEAKRAIEDAAAPYLISWRPSGYDDVMRVSDGNGVAVEVVVTDNDYLLSVEEFSERILEPVKREVLARG